MTTEPTPLPDLDILARAGCECSRCLGRHPTRTGEPCRRDEVLAVLQGLRACLVVEVRRLRGEAFDHDVWEAASGAMQHYSNAVDLADEALGWLGDDVSDLPDVDVEARAKR